MNKFGVDLDENNYKSYAFGILKQANELKLNRNMITDDESFCIEAMKVILELIGIPNLSHMLDTCIDG